MCVFFFFFYSFSLPLFQLEDDDGHIGISSVQGFGDFGKD
jgi:hypothetical protein